MQNAANIPIILSYDKDTTTKNKPNKKGQNRPNKKPHKNRNTTTEKAPLKYSLIRGPAEIQSATGNLLAGQTMPPATCEIC